MKKQIMHSYANLTPYQRAMMTAIKYRPSIRCRNKHVSNECIRCGKCGRKFKDGILDPKHSELKNVD